MPIPAGLQVWWALVDVGNLSDEVRAELAADLDVATIARLDRFVRAQDRDRGLAGHALLRRLLAAVVGGRPADLLFSTRCVACGSTEHGKPYLDLDRGNQPAPVELNLSHSGPLVCVALAPAGVPVGVDVEARRSVDWTSLRRSVFADAEWARTETASDPDRSRFDAWARKESSVKASGHGLALRMRDVLITDAPHPGAPAPGAPAPGAVASGTGIRRGGWTATLPGSSGATAGWDLGLRPEVSAAVAIHGLGDAVALPEPPDVRHVSIG